MRLMLDISLALLCMVIFIAYFVISYCVLRYKPVQGVVYKVCKLFLSSAFVVFAIFLYLESEAFRFFGFDSVVKRNKILVKDMYEFLLK